MKIVIAGSRNISLPPETIFEFLLQHDLDEKITQVVSGGADGIDKNGEEYADFFMKGDDKIKQFLPDREKYGDRAYYIRNKKMATYGDALLLIWDGSSDGSADMKKAMLELKKPVYEVIIRTYNVVKS